MRPIKMCNRNRIDTAKLVYEIMDETGCEVQEAIENLPFQIHDDDLDWLYHHCTETLEKVNDFMEAVNGGV